MLSFFFTPHYTRRSRARLCVIDEKIMTTISPSTKWRYFDLWNNYFNSYIFCTHQLREIMKNHTTLYSAHTHIRRTKCLSKSQSTSSPPPRHYNIYNKAKKKKTFVVASRESICAVVTEHDTHSLQLMLIAPRTACSYILYKMRHEKNEIRGACAARLFLMLAGD